MPIEVQGSTFFAGSEIAEEVGVSRQTLWRWRKAGKIPAGYKFRNGQVFFSGPEREAILRFANRIEPQGSEGGDGQLSLFGDM